MTTSIIDNQAENTLLAGLTRLGKGGQELSIATAFFSLNALLLIADTLDQYQHVRILFGDDADAKQRWKLMEMLRQKSDEELLTQRERLPQLSPLKKIETLFVSGRIEARCYTAQKFHAKAYLVHRPDVYPHYLGVIGSGNFTRPGLIQNIELNVELANEQLHQLEKWYEDRWQEAAADTVTEDVLSEIRRQITLYDPYVLYCKALAQWGQQQQDLGAVRQHTALVDQLDPHQWIGFSQAVKIIEREHGVMICDGVGLGKSFIALALMEYYCRQGNNVLLVAPKNVLDTSWREYLSNYLGPYLAPFGNIHPIPMTKLGFDPQEQQTDPEKLRQSREEVKQLADRADVIVIDESHNFRTTSADRYHNLLGIVAPHAEKRKKVILLTATPINTAYRDLSAQIALVTQDHGNIGGYPIEKIKKITAYLDREARATEEVSHLQLNLHLNTTGLDDLGRVLESVVIQRSRKTCKGLSEVTGKPLRFPSRQAPECVEYKIGTQSDRYRDLVALAQKRFQPGVVFLERMRQELKDAEEKKRPLKPAKVTPSQLRGIKLAAFLTEQYRNGPRAVAATSEETQASEDKGNDGLKTYRDEVHLAGLVFSNTLKQLESSPAAFQGILQSLGTGLLARLEVAMGTEVQPYLTRHQAWLRTPLFPKENISSLELDNLTEAETEADLDSDGETLDASGGEPDAWLAEAVAKRGLVKKLRDFRGPLYDVRRWREDIASDLEYLKEIHAATLQARQQPDPKLEAVLPVLRAVLAQNQRVLIFTQSQRTAEYLELALKSRLEEFTVARIDSRVEKTRAAILHAFCPGYNRKAIAPSVPPRLDVLISTDVLSEGVNLQEAGAICNYDIHWNPVRLIQRIGRVDRRLDPVITPEIHSFRIINVLPPPEIDSILRLVGTVENRTIRISRTLGLDEAFFKSTDPAGTLIEYNHLLEGDTTPRDAALIEYTRQIAAPDPALLRILDQLPPGAFGVWDRAPLNGLFALFTLQPTRTSPDADKQRYQSLLGRPLLALERAGLPTLFDAGSILEILAGTEPGRHSGTPSDEQQLSERLKKLRDAARQQFGSLSLPGTIRPQLVCWMELKKAS